jgi:hypothetical protein
MTEVGQNIGSAFGICNKTSPTPLAQSQRNTHK